MSKYLLPCSHCGEELKIDIGQAGQVVKCACGAEVEVPTMREIRGLARIDDERDAEAEQPTWSPRQGMLFATGLPVAILAMGVCGYLLWQRAQLDTTRPADVTREAAEARYDAMSAGELWDEWRKIRHHELSRTETPEFELNRIRAQQMLIMAIVSGVAGVAGLCLMGAALVLKPEAPRRAKPRAAKAKS